MNKTILAVVTTVVLAVSVGTLRFFVPTTGIRPEDIYKDSAHLYVGFLAGAAAVAFGWLVPRLKYLYGALFLILIAVELTAAFVR